MTSFTFAPLGSISSGTLNLRDLGNAYVTTLVNLARLDEANPTRARLAKLKAANTMDLMVMTMPDEELLAEKVNEDLPDMLNQYALPFTSFGAHEGDGSDFGFWIDYGALDFAIFEGKVRRRTFGVESRVKPEVSPLFLYDFDGNGKESLTALPSGIVLWSTYWPEVVE